MYANFGTAEDYETLGESHVPGNIVLVRVGRGVRRGLQVFNAAQRKAAAILMFADPQDAGQGRGAVYPHGAWLPPSGIQRGTAMMMGACSGDPYRNSTVGLHGGASSGCMLPPEFVVPDLPSLPISSEDAAELLKQLEGKGAAPVNFQGGLSDLQYYTGPSENSARLVVNNTNHVGPIWNVFATIPGKAAAAGERPIILGNRRDAWVYGATAPNSGSAALIEVAKGFASLLKSGWQPLRTIILASWDGGEPGNLGSTHYVESNVDNLTTHAVAYLNVESAVSGHVFSVAATPSLGEFIRSVAKDVVDPIANLPLSRVWNGQVEALASNSDYEPFFNARGVASVDMGFTGNYGVKGSVYDSYAFFEKNFDPRYMAAIAKFWGLMAIRLADAVILPFDIWHPYEMATQSWINLREASKSTLCVLEPHWLESASAAISSFGDAARLLVAEREDAITFAKLEVEKYRIDPLRLVLRFDFQHLNDRLAFFERKFLGSGLPGRPWFKHLLTAPDWESENKAVDFPGAMEALKGKNCDSYVDQCVDLTLAFYAAGTYIEPMMPTPFPPGPEPEPHRHGVVARLGKFLLVCMVLALGGMVFRKVAARAPPPRGELQQSLAEQRQEEVPVS